MDSEITSETGYESAMEIGVDPTPETDPTPEIDPDNDTLFVLTSEWSPSESEANDITVKNVAPASSVTAVKSSADQKQVVLAEYDARWKKIEDEWLTYDVVETPSASNVDLHINNDNGTGIDLAQGDAATVTPVPATNTSSTTSSASVVTASKSASTKPAVVSGVSKQKAPGEVDPEEDEVNILKMPTLKVITDDITRLHPLNKKVSVYPLTQEEIYHPVIVQCMNSDDCREFRLQFTRPPPTADDAAAKGLLNLYFSSKEAANKAADTLKEIRCDLTISVMATEAATNKILAEWNAANRTFDANALQDRTLYVSNVHSDATLEQLRQLFPTADEVVIPSDKPLVVKGAKKPGRPKGYALIVYSDAATAEKAVEQYKTKRPHLLKKNLGVYRYKQPVAIPKGLLSLSQRRLVLKHGVKAAAIIRKAATTAEETKQRDSGSKKLKACVELIEKDNETRRSVSLPTPSYKELLNMKNIPQPDSKQSQQMLEQLGVIDKNRGSFSAPSSATARVGGVSSSVSTKFVNSRNKKRFGRTSQLGTLSSFVGRGRGGGGFRSGGVGRLGMSSGYKSTGAYGRLGGGGGVSGFSSYNNNGGSRRGESLGGYRGTGGSLPPQEFSNSVGMLMDLSCHLMNQYEQQKQQRGGGFNQQQQQFKSGGGGGYQTSPLLSQNQRMLPQSNNSRMLPQSNNSRMLGQSNNSRMLGQSDGQRMLAQNQRMLPLNDYDSRMLSMSGGSGGGGGGYGRIGGGGASSAGGSYKRDGTKSLYNTWGGSPSAEMGGRRLWSAGEGQYGNGMTSVGGNNYGYGTGGGPPADRYYDRRFC